MFGDKNLRLNYPTELERSRLEESFGHHARACSKKIQSKARHLSSNIFRVGKGEMNVGKGNQICVLLRISYFRFSR